MERGGEGRGEEVGERKRRCQNSAYHVARKDVPPIDEGRLVVGEV